MRFNRSQISRNLWRLKKIEPLLFFILLVWLIPFHNFLHAQNPRPKIRIGYDDDLISIFAEDADLTKVLSKLADDANISVSFPDSLEKKITIRINAAPLTVALKRLLSDYNYAMVYSGEKKIKQLFQRYIFIIRVKSQKGQALSKVEFSIK